MSTQKLRTPKGLAWLAAHTSILDKNERLFFMQKFRNMHCAVWTECVWQLADAFQSSTKFIISDHPVTVYNRGCFPLSKWCLEGRDPDIRLNGTHTLFPLSLDKILILTNLSWVRNPYQNPTRPRPNPGLFRTTYFDWRAIQTLRHLSETEVCEINFIIKNRALRYVAAAREEWLHPENHLPTEHWSKLGNGYLLMPDPRSVVFMGDIFIGYKNNRTDALDEYGRRPWEGGYSDDEFAEREMKTFERFQGEFSRLYGPERRGRSFSLDRLDPQCDDDDYHNFHLSLEGRLSRRR